MPRGRLEIRRGKCTIAGAMRADFLNRVFPLCHPGFRVIPPAGVPAFRRAARVADSVHHLICVHLRHLRME